MKQFFIVSFCLLLGSAGCWKDDLTPQLNNDTQCEGVAPQADLQDGVCAGALKVCHTSTLEWVEPDYTGITGYEATEATCDGVDNDCDGTIDEELTTAFYPDLDDDGYGDVNAAAVMACTAPANHVADHTDCDDTRSGVNPAATEVCDGLDNNCAGGVDDNLTAPLCAKQADVCAGAKQTCGGTSGWLACTDANYLAWNGAYEATELTCDGLDNDCDSSTDEGVQTAWYPDADGDTYGSASASAVMACTAPANHVTDHTDCDDTRSGVNPAATEVCDGLDNNCNGSVDDNLTAPLCAKQAGVCLGSRQTCGGTSGWLACTDANYLAWNGAYEATEATCDGLDNNCDSSTDEGVQTAYYPDADGDTYGSASASAVMACTAPADHVTDHTDCDDTRAAVHPGATELCDGLDDDCNAATADGSAETWLGQACDGTDADLCNEGTFSCTTGAKTCSDPNDADPEICNGLDEDCDGVIDAGTCGAHASCYDAGGTQDATCECDSGYVELPAEPGVCHEAQQPDVGDLVITEVMIQPTHAATTLDGQYFEIYNTTDATLVLSDIGFYVTDGFLDATSEVGVAILLAPKARWIVGANATPAENGGLTVDHEFPAMVEFSTLGGGIEIYRVSDNTLIDDILWDVTWNHAAGASLSLSPGAPDADIVTLNDEGAHWCRTRFTTYGAGDRGTPGSGNDHCLIQWCTLQWPASTTTTEGVPTENIFGQVYEPGVTEAGGQGAFITAQLGYGGSGTPADGTWTWVDAVYNVDAGNNDEYRQTLTLGAAGEYDYAYRMSMDGGLTHVICDTDGVHGYGGAGVYDFAFNGSLTVNLASPYDGTLIYVPAGTFQRDVTPTNLSVVSAFYMSQHEITRAQWVAVTGWADPSHPTYSSGPNDPVQQVSWYDAIAFCNKLSLAEGRTPVYGVSGVDFTTLTYAAIPTSDNATWNAATVDWNADGYRLPTEMEWMWAAMGADTANPGAVNTTGYAKAFAGSTGTNAIGDYAVFGYYGSEVGRTTTMRSNPVGSKLENELGFHDLSGNVIEWAWDWYGMHPSGTVTDYRGPASGANRVLSGGGWGSYASGCTVAYRVGYGQGNRNYNAGFRVVRP